MRRLASATLAVAGLALGGAAGASAASPVPVHIEFQAFNPTPQDALPGETVQWENVSTRRHTVTADDGSFDSGDVFGGDRFAWKFATVGAYGYHCRVHPGMTGEIDVRRVTLGVMPTGLVPSGQKVPVKGRTADSVLPVQIERSTGGAFQTVATAVPAPDGTWNADVTAEKTAQYRASTPTGVSETRELRVSDRKVEVHATKKGVSVKVVPADPYAAVVLELRLRERFGWWPAARRKLDYLSEATFRVGHPVRARVVLVERDGWTPRAVSPSVLAGR